MRRKRSLAPDTRYTGSGTVVWMRIRDFFKRFSASGAAPGDGVQHQTPAMAPVPRTRRRLFTKYVALFVAVVSSLCCRNGIFDVCSPIRSTRHP